MPRFDGTGPQGAGPMTGRGQGRCNPNGSPYTTGSYMGMGSGQGSGRALGGGRGMSPNSRGGFSGRGAGLSRRGSGFRGGKRGRR